MVVFFLMDSYINFVVSIYVLRFKIWFCVHSLKDAQSLIKCQPKHEVQQSFFFWRNIKMSIFPFILWRVLGGWTHLATTHSIHWTWQTKTAIQIVNSLFNSSSKYHYKSDIYIKHNSTFLSLPINFNFFCISFLQIASLDQRGLNKVMLHTCTTNEVVTSLMRFSHHYKTVHVQLKLIAS